MARKTTAEGMEVKAFADHLGKSVQWARKLKREGAPEWQAWAARREAAPRPSAAVVLRQPMSDLERAEQAKEMAWQIYQRAVEAAQVPGLDATAQVALNRAVKEARDAYEKACKHATAALVEAQEWVPVARVHAIRQLLGELVDIMQNAEVVLVGAMPDDMRPALHRAFGPFKQAWNKGVYGLMDKIKAQFPTC